jgi:hypothetical protein
MTSISIEGGAVKEYGNIIFLLAFSGVIILTSYLTFRFIWKEF